VPSPSDSPPGTLLDIAVLPERPLLPSLLVVPLDFIHTPNNTLISTTSMFVRLPPAFPVGSLSIDPESQLAKDVGFAVLPGCPREFEEAVRRSSTVSTVC
jgi:hypothetical protein